MKSSNPDTAPITPREAASLFAPWRDAPALLIAASGGPDSTALLWLAARWRKSLARGPDLHAVTVDHGLRKESTAEARAVKHFAASLGVTHRTLRWRGDKPATGLPAAAREARYRLLARAARKAGAGHILTGHTRDDQAETFLMRLSRGSGLAGLAAMAPQSTRDGLVLSRPFLGIPKSRLIATLKRSKIGFVEDPTNSDVTFTRPRWRALMPDLAREGLDARSLARLSSRLSRANQAIEFVTDVAERSFVRVDPESRASAIDANHFATLPDEIALRIVGRAIARVGHEGHGELGKLEMLLAALQAALRAGPTTKAMPRWKQTLAGAAVALSRGTIVVAAAPPRRSRVTAAAQSDLVARDVTPGVKR